MSQETVLDLFEKNFLTVSELTFKIKNILEYEFFDVWVVGEISNLSTPLSGHTYFTLKDSKASIRCVLFRAQKNIKYKIKNRR
jgi:exodeoxyribonuclease VII large subunit